MTHWILRKKRMLSAATSSFQSNGLTEKGEKSRVSVPALWECWFHFS